MNHLWYTWFSEDPSPHHQNIHKIHHNKFKLGNRSVSLTYQNIQIEKPLCLYKFENIQKIRKLIKIFKLKSHCEVQCYWYFSQNLSRETLCASILILEFVCCSGMPGNSFIFIPSTFWTTGGKSGVCFTTFDPYTIVEPGGMCGGFFVMYFHNFEAMVEGGGGGNKVFELLV